MSVCRAFTGAARALLPACALCWRRVGQVVSMKFKRMFKHLFMSDAQVRRAFPRRALVTIEQAIKASEAAHVGEIRFAVEGALDGLALFKGQTARKRATRVASLRDMSPCPALV